MRGLILCLTILFLFGCGKGDVGATGPSGAAGDTILSNLYCTFVDSGSGTVLTYIYHLTQFTNNDYFVEVEVSGKTTASSSRYYKTADINDLGSNVVEYALGSDLTGAWFFQKNGTTAKVSY